MTQGLTHSSPHSTAGAEGPAPSMIEEIVMRMRRAALTLGVALSLAACGDTDDGGAGAGGSATADGGGTGAGGDTGGGAGQTGADAGSTEADTGPGTADTGAGGADTAGGGVDASGGTADTGGATGADSDGGAPDPGPVPDDYKTTFTKVTERAQSNDHQGMMVEVWVNDIAKATWDAGSGTYPEGSILVKEHYADDASTDVMAWTTMEKLNAGYAPDTGDWYWEKVMGDGTVEMEGTPAMCTGCHSAAKTADWVWSKL